MIPNPLIVVILVTVLLATSYSDLKYHKISNSWIITGILLAFVSHLYLGGVEGIFHSIGGLIIGFLLFLPFYLLGGMAAGDVKLMAAVGALVGVKLAWITVLMTLISGGFLAFFYLVVRGDIKRYLTRYNMIMKNLISTRKFNLSYLSPEHDEVAAQRFPYALAIVSGVVLSLIFFITRLPTYMLSAY